MQDDVLPFMHVWSLNILLKKKKKRAIIKKKEIVDYNVEASSSLTASDYSICLKGLDSTSHSV